MLISLNTVELSRCSRYTIAGRQDIINRIHSICSLFHASNYILMLYHKYPFPYLAL